MIKKQRAWFWLPVVLVALGGFTRPSFAAPPQITKFGEVEPRTPISELPFTITESGSYYLISDLTETIGFDDGITVEADDVTIDLMGFSLIGVAVVPARAGIFMDGRKNVEVRNGTVRGFRVGIHEFDPSGEGHRTINVRSVDNTFAGIILSGVAHLVKDCTVKDNGLGIITGDDSTVTGNIASGNTIGIGIGTGASSTVTGNTANNNGQFGIQTGASSTLAGNTANNNGLTGIVGNESSTVRGNTANNNGLGGAAQSGIFASRGSTVIGNTARGNTDFGITADKGSTVMNNTVHLNEKEGINLVLQSLVLGNTAVDNNQVGGGFLNIEFCATCTVVHNHAP